MRSYGTPMSSTYHPGVDESDLVKDKDMILLYRSMIGSLNWLIALGRYDAMFATSTLSSYSMAPRVGHFDTIVRI